MEKKQRQSNFELMRLAAMFLVVLYHCVLHGELKDGTPLIFTPFSGNLVFSYSVGMWGLAGVGCFFLLTAYFGSQNNRVSTKKLCLLMLQTVFWALITEWFTITQLKKKAFGAAELIHAMVSPFWGNYWFVTAYLALELLRPVLNRIIEGLDEKTYRKLMILFTAVSPLFSTFGDTKQMICDLSIAVYYYMLWGYLKRHPGNRFERNCGKIFIGTLLLTIGAASGLALYFTKTGKPYAGFFTLMGRASIIQVILAVSLFYCFLHLNIGSHIWINLPAKGMLGVYLIHENQILFPYLWNYIFRIGIWFDGSPYYPGYLLKCVCLTFFAATAMDLIRLYVLEKPLSCMLRPADKLFERADRWLTDT